MTKRFYVPYVEPKWLVPWGAGFPFDREEYDLLAQGRMLGMPDRMERKRKHARDVYRALRRKNV